MAFDKLLSFTQDVSDLADQPALTPTELKAQFDAAPNELRTYFNNLIDDLTNIGLNNVVKKLSNFDLNSVDATGFYSFTGTTVNSPVSDSAMLYMINLKFDGTNRKQQVYLKDESRQYAREQVGGVWSSWARMKNSDFGIVSARKATDTSVNPSTYTRLNWDEIYQDKLGNQNAVNGRFTAPNTGRYQVIVDADFLVAENNKICRLSIYRNDELFRHIKTFTPTNTENTNVSGMEIVFLTRGEFIDIRAYHEGVSAKTVAAPKVNIVELW